MLVIQGSGDRGDTIKSKLTDAKVFKVGGVEKTIDVVGKTRSGDWAGVKTTAVET